MDRGRERIEGEREKEKEKGVGDLSSAEIVWTV